MSDKNKKIVIGAIIIAIILILVIVLIIFNKNRSNNEETLPTVELSELLDIEDIKSCEYEIKETEEDISSKYISKEKYEVVANVTAGYSSEEKVEGKMIYVRGNYDNVNIFKTEYKINKYEDKTMQVSNILQQFESVCEQYIGLLEEYEETEQLEGKNTIDNDRPLEESIYYEEKMYSKTFKTEDKQYDINFYKSGESIICELVRVL